MDDVISKTEPFEIELYGINAHPKWTKPREVSNFIVLFYPLFNSIQIRAMISKGKDELKSLMKKLDNKLETEGFSIKEQTRYTKSYMTLGKWNEIYVSIHHGERFKDLADTVNHITSFNGKLHIIQPVFIRLYNFFFS